MVYFAALAIAAGLGLGISALGGGFGIGRAAAAALEGTARQPEATNDLRVTMIIGAALIEALTIYALVTAILLIGKLPAVESVIGVLK